MKIVVLACFLLTFPAFISAQDANDVSLTIRFADGNSQFHVGEIIPLEMSFTANVSGKYDIEMRNYGRNGRLNMEQFHVTPIGRDPLAPYFSEGAWMSGGLGGPRELTSTRQIFNEDLNEWVALDEPGHYTLYVTSGRISRRTESKSEAVEVRSNSLGFEIIPANEAWQHDVFVSATTTLRVGSSAPEEKNKARRTLRFLDSPESLRELVRLLGTDPGSRPNSALGLAGSRHQDVVVRELEEQMNSPEVGLNTNYLYILAKLKFQEENGLLPPYPKTDKEEQKTWEEQRKARDRKFAALEEKLYEQAAVLADRKQGRAKAETIETVLLRPWGNTGLANPPSGLSGEEIAAAFADLTADDQISMLRYFWNRVKVREMAVPLKELAERSTENPMLRALVLRRFYELDPQEAIPVFLDEIKHPHTEQSAFLATEMANTLSMLPNQTLPEFDQLLTDRLEKKSQTMDLDAQLIGRFATKAMLPRVKAIYESYPARWPCVTEDGFFVYFLRVDPDFGVKRLAQAGGFCMKKSLAEVARMKRWGELEPTLIARLDGGDLWGARDAAEALAKYGSPKAEEALWERLRRFHQEWADRGNDLFTGRSAARESSALVGFQYGLVEALGGAQAWLLTNEQITQLEDLALGAEKENVKQWHWKPPVELIISCSGDDVFINFSGHYFTTDITSMANKMSQYPSGTKFTTRVVCPDEQKLSILNAIDDVADASGLDVTEFQDPN